MSKVGFQLSSEELYQRQQSIKKIVGIPVIVVGIQDPINIGSCFRACDALNCSQIIFVDCNLKATGKIEKISRHTNKIVSYRSMNTQEFTETIFQTLPPLVALEITSHSTNIFTSNLPDTIGLVIGSEKHGISDEILQLCTVAVHIPMFGINSSMNVVMALAIALYEVNRQKQYINR